MIASHGPALGWRIVGVDGQSTEASRESPGLHWTLRQLFELHYRPHVLPRRRAKPASIERYLPLLDRWDEFAAATPLRDLTPELTARFAAFLAARRIPGGLSGKSRPMSPATVLGELVRLRALVKVLGPSRQSHDGCLGLLPQSPWVDCHVTSTGGKSLAEALRDPSLDDFRRWLGAIAAWPDAAARPGLRALLGLGFYTGYRMTAMCCLRWRHLVDVPGRGQWIDVRQLPQSERKRSVPLPVHPCLARLLSSARDGLDPASPLLPPSLLSPAVRQRGGILDRFRARLLFIRLQRLAGETSPWTPHDWRAGHIRAIGEAGFAMARAMATQSVGHSRAAVTEKHYWNAQQAAVMLLPDLD
jgi:hypothetical protein